MSHVTVHYAQSLDGRLATRTGGTEASRGALAVQRRVEHLADRRGEHELEPLSHLRGQLLEVGLVFLGNDYGVDLSLLASTEAVVGQYSSNKSQTGLRIFPAIFSPVACNWQSKSIPQFYRDLTGPIARKIELDNIDFGIEYPLSFLTFQGYSAIQKQGSSERP